MLKVKVFVGGCSIVSDAGHRIDKHCRSRKKGHRASGVYICGQCTASFDSPFKLSYCRKREPCKNKMCKDCKCVFKEYKQLFVHENSSKKITYTHCSNVFCTNNRFQKHVRSIKPLVNKADILCVFCLFYVFQLFC